MDKPVLILIHGWGWSKSVWQPLIEVLGEQYQIKAIDLPGYGQSKPVEGDEAQMSVISNLVESMLDDDGQNVLLGWSLGGMIALKLAVQLKNKISRVIAVGSNLQFIANDTWPYGLTEKTWDSFYQSVITRRASKSLTRFFQIQRQGAERNSPCDAWLKESLSHPPQPCQQTLLNSLDLLKSLSLNRTLTDIECPHHLLFGRQDPLVSPLAHDAIAQRFPAAACHLIDDAGHAAWLSHPHFIEKVIRL